MRGVPVPLVDADGSWSQRWRRPPDAEDTADRLAIDAVLADLRWQRRPPSGADVLAVADRYQGRAIAHRQSQFVYESTSPSGHRATKATFSTAAAARRFMLIELGADGRATLPIGDRGHQQALTFSVVVTAELAEVAASYRHPNGEPLFGPGPP